MTLNRIKAVSSAPKSAGNTALIRHLRGERISRGQAMKAKCAECMCYHVDGRLDCRIPKCPLYPWMPYRDKAQVPLPGKKSAKRSLMASGRTQRASK